MRLASVPTGSLGRGNPLDDTKRASFNQGMFSPTPEVDPNCESFCMKSQQTLSGRVALVTGAGSGIGEAAARLFAVHGGKVGVLSRTASEVKKLARDITKDGGEAMPLIADVADAREMESAFKKLHRKWKRLDVVFANAGINGVWAPLIKLKIEEWDETIRINLRGTFLTVKLATPYLTERGGSVIVTASVNGTRMFSNVGASAYATTKAAQVAFAKMIAVELGKQHIRVNAICPGGIETEINDNTEIRASESLAPRVEFPEGKIPLTGKRPGTANQVAELALFLASDASSHITGAEIFIDGAQSLLQG
jgi:NAD(P)-dependent dehydrogenase (short-subunit alcohol dehydrogenase family)